MKNSFKLILYAALLTVAYSSQSSAQWETNTIMDSTTSVYNLFAFESGVYVVLKDEFGISFKGLFLSKDRGETWLNITDKFPSGESEINDMVINNNTIFAVSDEGIFSSSDGGDNWAKKYDGFINKLYSDGTTLFSVGTTIYKSADDGENWDEIETDLNGQLLENITGNSEYLFLQLSDASFNQYFLRSADGGANWEVLIQEPYLINLNDILVFRESTLFLGYSNNSSNGGGLWYSIDNGSSFTALADTSAPQLQGNNTSIWGLFSIGPDFFVSASNGQYFAFLHRQTDGKWKNYSNNLDSYAKKIEADDLYFYLAHHGRPFISRRPLTDFNLVTSVRDNISKLPAGFNLSQNYPNPFNPSTTISYQLPESGFVELAVYDMLGRKITTLVNEQQSAGSCNVKFDAKGLASGLYFYRLNTENFSQVHKMVLTK